jgi:type I restriction-modification system DNA methylase subunit
VIGNDVETTLVDLTVLSLAMNAAEGHGYHVFDSNIYEEPPPDLGSWSGNVDFILANPPFSLPIERLDSPTRLYAIGYRNSDALFLDRARSFLRPGGRLVCLLPHSIVANAEFERLRHAIEDDWELLGVIGMPEGVFWTTARSSTRADILILEKSRRSDTKQPLVFAFAPSVGVPLNGRRQELDQGPNYLAEVVRDRGVRQALQLRDAG